MKPSRFPAALLALLLLGCESEREHLLSQESLRRQFEAHRAQFEELRRLFVEDSHLVRIAPTFTRLNDDWSWPRENVGLTEERWNTYRRLFRDAGVVDGLERDGDLIMFAMSSVGLSVTGASRGVVYTERPPTPLATSFDALEGEGIIFVGLDGHWYLFHWVTY
jgi:hypothetical protein